MSEREDDRAAADEGIEWDDRYTALGLPRHPVRLVCGGACEGTGVIPVYLSEGDRRDLGPMSVVSADEDNPALVEAWWKAEAEAPADDGWHFVSCPDCAGTGIAGGPSDRNHYRGRIASGPDVP